METEIELLVTSQTVTCTLSKKNYIFDVTDCQKER